MATSLSLMDAAKSGALGDPCAISSKCCANSISSMPIKASRSSLTFSISLVLVSSSISMAAFPEKKASKIVDLVHFRNNTSV